MPSRNYYVVLGVPPDESQPGIHAAYHDLVRRLHPDVAGETAATRFQEINEAYQVLSDRARRRAHDRETSTGVSTSYGPSPAPEEASAKPLSPFAYPERVRPSHDALHDRWLRNFTGIGVPKAERAESLTLEIALTPEEAARGCTVPVGVPVFGACLECGGTRRAWPFPCRACRASGLAEELRTLRLRVPPGVRHGTILELPLAFYGIANLYLRVRISVGAED
jgi:DnaJ-class molecular chaperone